MLKKGCRFIALLLLFILALTTTTTANTLDSIVAFGDSLSDNGNLFYYTGLPSAPYYEGRFSNGPVWVEYLADTLETPLENKAFGGATTGYGNYFTGTDYWGLTWQIDTYLDSSPLSGPNHLYTIWAGANDFFDNPLLPPDTAVDNISNALNRLSGAGAQNILIINMPDLGMTPEFSSDPDISAWASGWSMAFNDLLASDLTIFQSTFSGNLYALDALSIFDTIAGQLSNISDAYLPEGLLAGLDADDFLYWDEIHPTTEANRMIAEIAAETVAPVPEPTTLILVGTGLIGIVGVGRKKYIR